MSAGTHLHAQREAERASERGSVLRASVIVAGAVTFITLVVANIVVRFIGLKLVDISDGFAPLTRATWTVVLSFIYMLGAVIILSLLMHYSSQPRRHFVIASVIAFVLSFIPLLALSSSEYSSTGALLILAAMHVVSVIIAVPLLLRLVRSEMPADSRMRPAEH